MRYVRTVCAIPLFILFAIGTIALLLLFGCYPTYVKRAETPQEALKRIRYFFPRFEDDLDLNSLKLAIERNLEYLRRLDPDHVFSYGSERVTCKRVIDTQQSLLQILLSSPTPTDLQNKIKRQFIVMKAAGMPRTGRVLFTGYFEPTYEASLVKNQVFKFPIYAIPDDLVTIDLSLFRKRFQGLRLMGRLQGRFVVPYYSRDDIDIRKVLKGKNLEIAWLKDPVDVLFLQIQGSGRLMFPSGRSIRVGYAASNGHPYKSIGRYMIKMGYIDREEMSMQKIREFLHNHPFLLEKILAQNPSYVFFRILDRGPLGNIGVPLTPGRSIALDTRLFPKGALGFIHCKKPVLDTQGKIIKWVPFSRFVLNQDTGGAIKGAGRADIFWGSDRYAEVAAGHMKHQGELYILLKKKHRKNAGSAVTERVTLSTLPLDGEF